MSDLLSLGASGVRAYQSALGTVSENIANTGVAGYSRRSVELREVASTSGSITANKVLAGNGVLAVGVNRSADAYRATGVRSAGADLARTEAGSVWLDKVQTALTGAKLGDRLTSFFTAAQGLAADPTSVPQRAVMLEQATTLAASFTATGAALDTAATDLDGTAKQAVQTLDSLGAALAKVNGGLARNPAGGAAAAALSDQRDQLLEQMSAIADVAVETDAAGRATVRLGGPNGAVLVSGTDSGHVTYQRDPGGAVAFSVQRAGTVTSFAPNGGALAGVTEGAQRIADTRLSLNALANDFTTEVNAVQADGRDLDGNAGAALFAQGTTPTDLTVTLTEPRGIAAAAMGGGTRDASNLQALQSARGAHGWEAAATSMVTGNAAALQQRGLVADAQTAIRDGAVAARDQVSGVDLDTEAVDLLRFQQAYQASSRVIQVARETFQSILAIN